MAAIPTIAVDVTECQRMIDEINESIADIGGPDFLRSALKDQEWRRVCKIIEADSLSLVTARTAKNGKIRIVPTEVFSEVHRLILGAAALLRRDPGPNAIPGRLGPKEMQARFGGRPLRCFDEETGNEIFEVAWIDEIRREYATYARDPETGRPLIAESVFTGQMAPKLTIHKGALRLEPIA